MLLNPDPQSQYGSGSAFPIRIRIQDSQISADTDPQHWLKLLCIYSPTVCVLERAGNQHHLCRHLLGGTSRRSGLCQHILQVSF
jgi:hypothetical protein